MIGNIDYDKLTKIIQAFLNNKEFTDRIMKEYLVVNDANKMRDYQVFVEAYNAFKNNKPTLSKEAIALIEKNKDEYIKVIDEINNKSKTTTNQNSETYIFNAESFDTSNFNPNSSSNTYTGVDEQSIPINLNSNSNEPTNNSNDNQDIDYYDYENGHVYSSTHAKREIEKQIQDLDKNIADMENSIHSSKEKQSKNNFYILQEMRAKKENLEEQYKRINDLSKNYNDKLRTKLFDNMINHYQDKIEKKNIAINNAKFDSNKERMKSKLEKLKNKQGEIKDKQRKSIDKKIFKIYNNDRRKNKLRNKTKALEEYKKYRDELINAKRNQSSIEIINKITNKIYDIRNIPLELQIATVKRLQKKQGTIQDTFMKNKANRFMQTTNKYQARHMAA